MQRFTLLLARLGPIVMTDPASTMFASLCGTIELRFSQYQDSTMNHVRICFGLEEPGSADFVKFTGQMHISLPLTMR